MKAVVRNHYGGPETLQLTEVAKPTPGPKDVVVRIKAATVTLGDCELRAFNVKTWLWLPLRLYMGLFGPRIKILGQEFSGIVEAIGKNVTRFKVGDEVFGPTDMNMGAYAEYKCLPESHALFKKPARISFEEAATIPTGGINGLHFVRKSNVKPGDDVLINGAGGSIGTYATQLAKRLGATVTCVDSGIKLDMLKSIGADHVIDYQQQDFTKGERQFDVIIDIVGISSYSAVIRCLKPGGRYFMGNPDFWDMVRSAFNPGDGKQVLIQFAPYKPEYFEYLMGLFEKGQLRSVIDRTFPLQQLREAHEYVDRGLKKGNVVISV